LAPVMEDDPPAKPLHPSNERRSPLSVIQHDDDVVADPTLAQSFAELGLPPDLVRALAAGGIEHPFPIQALCIPPALTGQDLCGKAKTGSGKTLAFGLPLLMRIAPGQPGRPTALVLVPTRELAVQVCAALRPLGEAQGRRVVALYGGAPMEAQIKSLRKGVDVVVATPGRLIDLGDRGDLSVADVEILVLDEADRMADMGFLPQVEWVLRRLQRAHQTLLFSATLDSDVDHLVRTYLQDPVYCELASDLASVEEMEHRFIRVHQMDKVKVCAAVALASTRSLVFVRTKRGADRLMLQLKREGVRAEAIHGDLRQSQRERALQRFSAAKLDLLVATDVAARGIHVDGIDVVIHYDPPEDHKAYLHRSGRTARAGEAGLVVTLVLWDQQLEVERLMRRLGLEQPLVEMFSNDERLANLLAWKPEGMARVRADGADEAATVAPRARSSAERTTARRSQGAVSPASALAASRAAAARKQALRSLGGRRRGRR
jgi:superfamily II DNA/RNA helicase